MIRNRSGPADGQHLLHGGLVLLVATVFHIGYLDTLPPGLDRDAAANGLLALKWIRNGTLPFWVPHASAPEPLMVWLQAVTTMLWGPSAFALRSVSAAATVLAVLAAYGLGWEINRGSRTPLRVWAGLFSGLGLACSVAYSEIGRTGLRASLLPAFEGFLFLTLLVGLRTGERKHFIFAGLLLGGAAYTYLAARFLPIVLLLFVAACLTLRPELRTRMGGFGITGGIAAILIAPQAIFFLRFPATFLERAGAVTLLNNPLYGQLGLWGVLYKKLIALFLMFGIQWFGQYNQSARPMLQPLALVGLIAVVPMVLRRFREPGVMLLSLALPAMLLPDLLGGDRLMPHELRVIGSFVPAHVLSGIGLANGLAWLQDRGRAWVGRVAGWGLALSLVAWGFADLYLIVAPRLQSRHYDWYARGEVAEAVFINAADAPVLLPLSEYSRWPLEYLSSYRVRQIQGGLDSSLKSYHAPVQQALLIWPEDAERPHPEGRSYRFDPQALVLIDGAQAYLMPPPRTDVSQLMISLEGRVIQTSIGERAARVYDVSLDMLGFPERFLLNWPVALSFADDLQLMGVAADRTTLVPNGKLGVTTLWQATGNTKASLRYFVHLLDDSQQLRATEDVMPGYGVHETDEWRGGEVVPLRQLVEIPADLPPGRYWLEIGFYDPLSGKRAQARDVSGAPAGDRALVGPLKVPLELDSDLPGEASLLARFSEEIELRGYRAAASDGKQLDVSLRLHALSRPLHDYTIFVHLLDSQDRLVAQSDAMPLGGTYPTSIWDPGETIITDQVVPIPGDLPPGAYSLWMGIYHWATGERLPIRADGRTVVEDRLLLDVVSLP